MLDWKTVQPHIGAVYYQGYCGKIRFFTIVYSMVGGGYEVRTSLPQLGVHFKSENLESCKLACDTFLKDWLNMTGLKQKGK